MAMVDADWTIDRATGNIRYGGADHNGAATYATVIQFRRWLGEKADDASSGTSDDEYDITDPTAADRKTDNFVQLLGNYNITQAEAEHLFDGSIIQGTGGTEVFFDGIINFGNSDVQIQIIQDGAVLADDWWNEAGAGLNPDAAQGISHRFLLETKTAGADIDGRRLIGTTRTFGNTYGEFTINGTSRGNNVLALVDSADLNNGTIEGTVAGWTGITLTTEGFAPITIGGVVYDFYSEWNTNQPTRSINDFYERMKWTQRDGSTETLWGLNGELFRGITHEWDVDGGTGTFSAFELLTFTNGTAQLLAVDNVTTPTKMWVQLLTGTLPGDNDLITGVSTATALAEFTGGQSLARPISTPAVGVSTGTALIGAYGFGVEADDLTANDKVFDLTNTLRTPPNNVTFTVFGTENGEDRLLVTNDNAGDIDYAQFTLNGLLSGPTVTTVTVNGAIPGDTPTSGTIRVLRVSGIYSLHDYSVWSGSDFTITSHNFSTDNAINGANTFISYLDLLVGASDPSFTGVYGSDRTYFIRDRDGGGTPIKSFETTGIGGANGGSATVIRTSDE